MADKLKDKRRQVLLEAVQKGDLRQVKEMFRDKVKMERPLDTDGTTAVHVAAANGDVKMLEFLIRKCRVSTNRPAKSGNTPLHLAAQSGHVGALTVLLGPGKADPTLQNHNGWTPLLSAVWHKRLDVVRALLALVPASFSLDQLENPSGKTSLMLAVLQGHNEVLSELVHAGADVLAKRTLKTGRVVHVLHVLSDSLDRGTSRNPSKKIDQAVQTTQTLLETVRKRKELRQAVLLGLGDKDFRTCKRDASSNTATGVAPSVLAFVRHPLYDCNLLRLVFEFDRDPAEAALDEFLNHNLAAFVSMRDNGFITYAHTPLIDRRHESDSEAEEENGMLDYNY
eukprot:g28358.t1